MKGISWRKRKEHPIPRSTAKEEGSNRGKEMITRRIWMKVKTLSASNRPGCQVGCKFVAIVHHLVIKPFGLKQGWTRFFFLSKGKVLKWDVFGWKCIARLPITTFSAVFGWPSCIIEAAPSFCYESYHLYWNYRMLAHCDWGKLELLSSLILLIEFVDGGHHEPFMVKTVCGMAHVIWNGQRVGGAGLGDGGIYHRYYWFGFRDFIGLG